MEKLYKPTRKVIVCFSNGEEWEEMNDEIKIVNLYGTGIRDFYHERCKKLHHLKEDEFSSYSLKKVFERFMFGDNDLTDFF